MERKKTIPFDRDSFCTESFEILSVSVYTACMPSPSEDIKSRLDIVEVIQGYTRLQKAGINYKALCPFHAEKTPSFFVSPSRQIWHCFGGCGKGGDIFKFIMEIEGVEFPEALRLLASRAGVVLRREDPRIRSERNRMLDICEDAARLFEKNLSMTPAVKKYLQERGVRDETLKRFRVGFAPVSWDFLLKSLARRGWKKEDLEKAGLIIRSEDGASWYDRFRGRIMFPITDANGHVIAFGGRIFEQTQKTDKGEAKYVNTPATLIYDKSRVLYGFDRAKQDIRAKNSVVIVEGYMDCIMSHQAGVGNTIAVSGTALTPQQLKVMRRLADRIVSSFDTDSAGDTATKRSLALAAQFGFERSVAAIPSGKDPADAVKENPEEWRRAVEEARPVVEFYFAKAFRENDPKTAAGKKAIASIVLPFIAELDDEIEKAHWIGEMARRLVIPEDSVRKALGKERGNGRMIREEVSLREEALPPRRMLLEERFLALATLVSRDFFFRELGEHHIVFGSQLHNELFEILNASAPAAPYPPHIQEGLDLLKFKGEILAQMTKDIEQEFILCKRELEKESVKERLLKIGEEIERLEKTGEQSGVTVLLQDFRTLSEKLKMLS